MATYNAEAYRKGIVYRPVSEEGPASVTATVKVPAGVAISTSDIFNFFKIGANVVVQELTLTAYGVNGSGTATGIFDGAAGTVNIGNDSSATAYVSASTALQSAVNSSIRAEPSTVAASTATRTIRVALANAGTQTTADDFDRYLTLTATLLPQRQPVTSQVPYHYADRYNTSGSSGGLVS